MYGALEGGTIESLLESVARIDASSLHRREELYRIVPESSGLLKRTGGVPRVENEIAKSRYKGCVGSRATGRSGPRCGLRACPASSNRDRLSHSTLWWSGCVDTGLSGLGWGHTMERVVGGGLALYETSRREELCARRLRIEACGIFFLLFFSKGPKEGKKNSTWR